MGVSLEDVDGAIGRAPIDNHMLNIVEALLCNALNCSLNERGGI